MIQIGCLKTSKVYILLHPVKYSNPQPPIMPLIFITLFTILDNWVQGTIENVTYSCSPLLKIQLKFIQQGFTESLLCAMTV